MAWIIGFIDIDQAYEGSQEQYFEDGPIQNFSLKIKIIELRHDSHKYKTKVNKPTNYPSYQAN